MKLLRALSKIYMWIAISRTTFKLFEENWLQNKKINV